MSRSKHAVELCTLLVDEAYGELTSRIFTILLRRGRLSVSDLSRHTHLTPRQLRHGLVVLIQQNLVYHHFDTENRSTYYEGNHDAAYALVRSGKILEIVESRYGVHARDVVQNLFLLGHIKVSDLAGAYESRRKPHINGKGHAPVNGISGHPKGHASSAGELDSILARLLQAGLIETVTERMFRSPTDTYNHAEREILQLNFGGSTKGGKQKDELKALMKDRLQNIRSNGPDWRLKGNKRTLNGDAVDGLNGAGKRRKLSDGGGVVSDDEICKDDSTRLDRDLVLRISYEKCTVALRNERLVQLANSRIGETTSNVYAELLSLLEANIPRCRLDRKVDDVKDLPDGPSVTTMDVAAALSKSLNVALGIGKASAGSIDTTSLERYHKSKKRKVGELEAEVEGDASSDEDDSEEVNGNGNISGVDQDSDSHGNDPFAEAPGPKTPKRTKVTFQDKLPKPASSEDRQVRLNQVRNHLLLLAADDCRFLRKCGSRGLGEWTVDFDRIIERMQEAEIDLMLLENFGNTGHRLARMMRKMGKLDEKQLPNLALMKQKDIRTKLAEMQMAGMVDTQEVPRDSARTTNRSIFLWYFDIDRVSSIFLDSIYKSMSRCLQRLDIERRRAKGVLSLTERSDVRDMREEEYLEPSQINDLQVIRAKEESLLGQVGRLDELVGIFRDY